jgi:predicted amidohydrolase
MHLYTPGGEEKYFRPGDNLVTIDVAGVRCTLFVCYDLRFADDFWSRAADTDAYLVVANWPTQRAEHWRSLLRARAIENQAYVVGVNRVGTADGNLYTGDSCVIDPWGVVLVSASTEETTLLADISPRRVRDVRAEYAFLQDRRDPGGPR